MAEKKLKIGKLLRMLFIKNNLKTKEVAEKLGKKTQAFNIQLSNGKMNLETIAEIMQVCDEKIVFKLSNGEEIEIEPQ